MASFASAVSNGGGRGVWASLLDRRARGDGHDVLGGFEGLEGSAFDDTLIGAAGPDSILGGPGDDLLRGEGAADSADGGSGADRCSSFGLRVSCDPGTGVTAANPGTEAPGSVRVEVVPSPAGGSGLAIVGGTGDDRLALSYDPSDHFFSVRSPAALGAGPGCGRLGRGNLACRSSPPLRRIVGDLGPGDDRLRIYGDPTTVGAVRLAGGPGDDRIEGGPSDDLIEGGDGADRLLGDAGSDGVVGGPGGPDRLLGGPGADLLAAGGACVGGVLAGGPGRDNASFAETPAHPGVLFASLARRIAYVKAIPGCHPVRLAASNEDLEGSFDYDVLVGDAGPNGILGQPGVDRLYGLGGRDVLDARDGGPDGVIDCGSGAREVTFRDRADPPPRGCHPARPASSVPVLPPR